MMKTKKPSPLSLHDFEKLQTTDLPSEELEIARDYFVLMCYTGLPYSVVTDIKNWNFRKKEGQLQVSRS